MARSAQTPKPTANIGTPAELPTFLEHVYELRRRLFWVVGVILAASGAAYPFLDTILSVITAPLAGQQLYYLTPVGGFSFSIKICFYIGIIVAVPIIMYHLYRYIEPLMGQYMRRSALFYVGFSTLMAVVGILFAYFVSLPGALHFLTGMDLKNIQAMLTVDSYLTFVMTYLLGAALLFQIPLLLTITNNMTPLQPKKLMKAQRFVIVGAFILAAIISPTPDIMNQVLLAIPVIAMYQFGVVLVWLQNRSRSKRAKKEGNRELPVFDFKELPSPHTNSVGTRVSQPSAALFTQSAPKPIRMTTRQRVVQHGKSHAPMDGFAPVRAKPLSKPAALQVAVPINRHIQTQKTPVNRMHQQSVRAAIPLAAPRAIRVPARSVDGFIMRRSSHMASSS